MPYHIQLHPTAGREFVDAYRWYGEQSEEVGARILSRWLEGMIRVKEQPFRWQERSPGTRQHRLHKFPFHIVYRAKRRTIEVIAIAHSKRKPGYWEAQ